MTLAFALDNLLSRYVEEYRSRFGTAPRQPYDSHWPSPCIQGPPDENGLIEWSPVRRTCLPDFSGLEHAIREPVHPDIRVFFGRYYCETIPGRTEEGGLQLIQVWSDQDFDRLVENTLGHTLAKFRAKEPLSLFVATTDEDEFFLSVDNATGRVMLEQPGKPVVREVAPDLATLLERFQPECEQIPDYQDG